MNIKLCKKISILAICIILMAAVTGCSQTKGKQTDLTEFYGITSDQDYVILLDGENSGWAYKEGDEYYLPYDVVNDSINDKFYYDQTYNRILFTTPDTIEMYDVGGDGNTKIINDQVYISLSCIENRTEMNCEVFTDPNRVAISQSMGTVTVCKPKKDNVIRQFNKDDANYMAEVSEGESLMIKDTIEETWYRVAKNNGITGYIKIEDTNGEETEERTAKYQAAEYSHITMDKTVCLGWHQMEGRAGNATLDSVVENGLGILNVVSPTWFKLADTTGNITSNAQTSYVNKAHNMGMQVWALADDFSYGEDGTNYVGAVLGSFDARQNLIGNLVSEVKACGADGINIDYEKIYEEIADDYIQFIRELSIECRKNGLVLSVDTYVSQAYNEFYNRKGIGEVADYLVIMGYDEHWAGDDNAGSVASLPYVQAGIEAAAKVMDADRIINGIPFYTRIWTETKAGYTTEGTFVEDAKNGNYYLDSTAVGMDAAMSELTENGVTPVWLDDLGQYYGEYQGEGNTTRIWLEEEKSVQAKLDVMANAGIGGVACWKLGLESTSVWDEIAAYVQK